MEVKPGYKMTEVGVIPEDWSDKVLSSLVASGPTNGYSGRSSKGSGGTPTLSLSATTLGTLVLNDETIKFLEETIDPRSDLFLKKGDVLVQRSNTLDLVGTTAVFDGRDGVYIYPDLMMRMRFRSSGTAHFFWRYANSAMGRRFFISTAAGSSGSMPKISGATLLNMILPLPPEPEQRAIATAISDMDALLDGLDRLIAKKRAIKQATMQQLLTGQTRLPGFSGEWEVKLLGEVANIKTGSKNNEDKADDGDYPFFVRSENIERIGSYSYDCEAILVPGEGRIGEIFHYITGKFDVHQRVYAITQFSPDVSGRFVHFYLSANFGTWAMQNTVKATVDSLRLPTFLNFQMHVPPTVEEQTAIATVLADMDTEITALETRRTKTRALKQAMMQELLTGRTRLIEPAENPIQEEVTHTEGRKANIHFLRSVLAAEIIDRLHDQPTFGHVKFEKMVFLVEHLCQMDTGSTYHRKAAGPYDNRALRSIDSQLQKQQWFEARKQEGRYQYVPLAKRGGHKPYFERHFSGIGETLEKILSAFRTAKTEQCEIVATLLAAWSDLLREKGTVSDEMIVHEVLHNWHEAKQRIPEDRWLMALGWMREKGFVPKGATLP